MVMKKIFRLFFILVSVNTFAQQKSVDYYLLSALQNSPLFVENKNQIVSLKYDSLRIRASFKPHLDFDSYNVYAPVINGFGYDNAITNGGAFTALVGANLSIIGKQNLSNQFQNIELQSQSLHVAGKLSEKELKQNISMQYINVYAEQQMLRNTEEVLIVLLKEDTILKKLAEQGVYRETDYLSFLVNYKQQELAYNQRKLQMKNDFALLNYSCGLVDTTYSELGKPLFEQKFILQSEQTLAFKQYLIDSMMIKNNYEQVKFGYKPHLNLFGDAGYNSSLAYKAQKNFGTSAGLKLAIPIYDGKQRYLRYEKIKLSENTRISYMQFYKKQYSQKVLQLQQQIKNTEQIMNEAEKQLSLSDALVQANRKLLITGDVKIVDYILALANYISSKSTVLQLRINKLQLINEFNYLNY